MGRHDGEKQQASRSKRDGKHNIEESAGCHNELLRLRPVEAELDGNANGAEANRSYEVEQHKS
jgi:hypothetical protein